jgi:TIR domain
MAQIPEEAPGRIFISYRREETAYPAGWLFDRLVDQYGSEVFKDVDRIELGDDFVEVINTAVGSCDVLLALIGDEWVTITDDEGRRRLDNPDDYVRLEIEAALARKVRVIPILVDGAPMPHAGELPASLGPLTRRQALELSPSQFDFDTGRLIKVLDKTLAAIRTEVHSVPAQGTPRSPATGGAPPAPTVPSAPDFGPHLRPADGKKEPPIRGGPRWGLIATAVVGVFALFVAALLATRALEGDEPGASDASDTPAAIKVKGTLQDLDVRQGTVGAIFEQADSQQNALGVSNLSRRDLEVFDSTGPGAAVDVGTDEQGKTVLLYSRCEALGRCDLYQSYPDGGAERPRRLRLSTDTCNVRAPSIAAGQVLFVRSGEDCADRGLFIKRPGEANPERLGAGVLGADFNGRVRATLSGGVLAITSGTKTGGKRTEFEGVGGTRLNPPLVLDGDYVYFQERLAEGEFAIARLLRGDDNPVLERYLPADGSDPVGDVQHFGVSSRQLYYSRRDRVPNIDVIEIDASPEFEPVEDAVALR